MPSKPDGGDEEYTFSPDATHVVFSARVAGRDEPWSTNFDLYEAPSDGRAAPREPDPRQSRLGHAAGVPAQRRPCLARDEAARLRSRPLRDHGFARRQPRAKWRRNWDRLGRASRRGTRTAARCWPPPATSGRTRCSRSMSSSGARHAALGPRARSAITRRGAQGRGRGLARPRHPARSLSTRGRRRAPRRLTTPTRHCSRARTSAPSSNSASRAGTAKPCTATWSNPSVSRPDRNTRSRSSCTADRSELPEPLELALERPGLRGARLRRGVHRLPRLARLRPGVHRFHQPALGRPARSRTCKKG